MRGGSSFVPAEILIGSFAASRVLGGPDGFRLPGWNALGRLASWLHATAGSRPRRTENSGGPRSRTRRERIVRDLLGTGAGELRWIRRGRVYRLDWNGWDGPVERAEGALEALGFANPEQAVRELPGLPERRLHVHEVAPWIQEPPAPKLPGLPDGLESDREHLRNALVLGRCVGIVFDPERPVIWTRRRLERCLELYQPRRFYRHDD